MALKQSDPLKWVPDRDPESPTRYTLTELGDCTWVTHSQDGVFGEQIPDSVILAAAKSIKARGVRVPFDEG